MAKKKILIVDDDQRISNPMAECLIAKGFEVKVANDSMQGIQLVHQIRPDLILLDLLMPAGGGVAVLESIRSSVHLQTTPILVMTGTHDPLLRKQLLQYRITTYLQKPFEFETLLRSITDILSPS